MVVKKVIAVDEEILEKLEEVLKKENAKKPKMKQQVSSAIAISLLKKKMGDS